MSGKSQKLLDLLLVTINVFKPEEPNQKINYDALNTLLTMVQESIEAKKKHENIIELEEYEEYEEESDNQAEDVENLLNLLAKKQDDES
jgi:hypothetical protein